MRVVGLLFVQSKGVVVLLPVLPEIRKDIEEEQNAKSAKP
jgi:hypothetical protein